MKSKQQDGVHALLITQKGEILLQQKTLDYTHNRLNRGKISMYGGGIEPDEEELSALHRELKEELGIDSHNYAVEKLSSYHKTAEEDGVEHNVHVYIVKTIDKNTLKINSSDNEESAAECVIDSAEGFLSRTNITRLTRFALQDFLDK